MATQASKIRTCSDLRAYFCGQGCELFTAVEDIHQPFDISGTNSWLEGQQSGSATLINFCLSIVIFSSMHSKKTYEMLRVSLLIADKFRMQGCKRTKYSSEDLPLQDHFLIVSLFQLGRIYIS